MQSDSRYSPDIEYEMILTNRGGFEECLYFDLNIDGNIHRIKIYDRMRIATEVVNG